MQYWLNNQFCRLVFSFYVWERPLDQLLLEVLVRGLVEIPINVISAVLAVLGIVGTIKRVPLLAHLYSFDVGFYLCYWAGRILVVAMFADNFTLSSGVAWTLTILASVGCLLLLALSGYFLAYKFYLDLKAEEDRTQKVFYCNIII